jgi:hypothetical protein
MLSIYRVNVPGGGTLVYLAGCVLSILHPCVLKRCATASAGLREKPPSRFRKQKTEENEATALSYKTEAITCV